MTEVAYRWEGRRPTEILDADGLLGSRAVPRGKHCVCSLRRIQPDWLAINNGRHR